MSWYERKNFDEYFQLVLDFEETHPLRKQYNNIVYTTENVNLYLIQLNDFYKKQFQTTYLKNLYSLPLIQRLILNPKQFSSFLLPKIEKRLLSRVGADERFVTSYPSGSPRNSYLHLLTTEFRNYLYLDRPFELAHLEKIKKNIYKILELYDDINKSQIYLNENLEFIEGRHFEHHKKKLQMNADSINISRYRSNHREIIFAENIISHHLKFFNRPRISLVLEFMCLPFFDRKLDVSTLNRINRKLQAQNLKNSL